MRDTLQYPVWMKDMAFRNMLFPNQLPEMTQGSLGMRLPVEAGMSSADPVCKSMLNNDDSSKNDSELDPCIGT